MQEVSLKDFLMTGKFGEIKLGITQAKLKSYLGTPDKVGSIPRNHIPILYMYGSIEFHFSPSIDRLWMIFSDNFGGKILGNGNLLIDSWIIHRKLTVEEFEEEAIKHNINYTRLEGDFDAFSTILQVGAGIEMAFYNSPNLFSKDIGLYRFSYTKSFEE